VVRTPIHKALLWQSYLLDLNEVQKQEMNKGRHPKR